jgi:uncharacterized membrane protein YdfJ with MMPL/SSD domain
MNISLITQAPTVNISAATIGLLVVPGTMVLLGRASWWMPVGWPAFPGLLEAPDETSGLTPLGGPCRTGR